MGETGDEDESGDEANQPLSLFRSTDYARMCEQDPSLVNESEDTNLKELAKIHALYRSLAEQSTHVNNNDDTKLQPSSLVEILSTSRDSLVDVQKPEAEYESICSDLELHRSCRICSSCNKEKIPVDFTAHQPNGINTDMCNCDMKTNLQTYIPSSLYMIPKNQPALYSNRSQSSLEGKIPALHEVNYNNVSEFSTLDDKKNPDCSLQMILNDRVPNNGVPVPDFIEDADANVILCNPVQYNFSLSPQSDDGKVCAEDVTCSNEDDDSDCLSNVSDDSEYMMRTSKLSKFLCVGVGRSKSKTPYKLSKQNFKNESKKNAKMKESKSKSSSKSRDSSKSPDFDSKNLLKSPSRVNSQTISKSSSGSSSTTSGWKSDSSKSNRWNKFSSSSKGLSNYSTNSSFSYQAHPVEGYDSGHESGITPGSSTPQEIPEASWSTVQPEPKAKATGQRLPIPASKSGTGSSLGTTPSLGDSSGYGSMARDSECSSFSSSQDSELEEEKKSRSNSARVPVKVENFTEEDIQRYEGRSSRNVESLYSFSTKQRNKIHLEKINKELAESTKNNSDTSWSFGRKKNVSIFSITIHNCKNKRTPRLILCFFSFAAFLNWTT